MSRTLIAVMLIAGAAGSASAQDVTYRRNIAPLFTLKCAGCHGPASPYLGEFTEDPKRFAAAMKGPRMDSYADLIMYVGWPDTGAIQRRLDDGKSAKDGKPGNMYAYLGANDEERARNLALFKEWVGKDAWKLNRWTARGEAPAITKEDLDRIKVPY